MASSIAMGIITVLLVTGMLVYSVLFFYKRQKIQKTNLDRFKKSPAPHTYFDKYAKRSDLLKAAYPTESDSAAHPPQPHSHSAEKQ
ncbi:MAG: hypothetical protein HPY51_16730 [Candidatus Omnitrophica bacterium]|nr:hypothetical protein [Candidatus Omnitrophota bacterium]